MVQILVIEDDWDSRNIMRTLLERAGYEVIEAVTGPDGVSTAEDHQPNLILMDVQLPGYDGFEATRRIKADPALRRIPIIIVTSLDMTPEEVKAKGSGCDGFVSKPFRLPDLLETVHSFLPKL